MSSYATIAGKIRYEDAASFKAAVGLLEEGGWVKGDYFLDELGRRITSDPNIHYAEHTIDIPPSNYWNLIYLLVPERFLAGGVADLFWSTTDGVAAAGIFKGGVEQTIKLVA